MLFRGESDAEESQSRGCQLALARTSDAPHPASPAPKVPINEFDNFHQSPYHRAGLVEDALVKRSSPL